MTTPGGYQIFGIGVIELVVIAVVGAALMGGVVYAVMSSTKPKY